MIIIHGRQYSYGNGIWFFAASQSYSNGERYQYDWPIAKGGHRRTKRARRRQRTEKIKLRKLRRYRSEGAKVDLGTRTMWQSKQIGAWDRSVVTYSANFWPRDTEYIPGIEIMKCPPPPKFVEGYFPLRSLDYPAYRERPDRPPRTPTREANHLRLEIEAESEPDPYDAGPDTYDGKPLYTTQHEHDLRTGYVYDAFASDPIGDERWLAKRSPGTKNPKPGEWLYDEVAQIPFDDPYDDLDEPDPWDVDPWFRDMVDEAR